MTNNLKRAKSDVMSLSTANLKLQLESYKEVVKRCQEAVFKEQALCDTKMNEVWRKTLEFIEKANIYHDTKGISSPWWNAQFLKIQNPVIFQESSARRQRKNQLERLIVDIKNKELSVGAKEKEIFRLKEKMSYETAKILDLKKIENELYQEPFGFEFISLKNKVECRKQTCLQLSSTIGGISGPPQENSSFRFKPKEPRMREPLFSPQINKGESVDKMTTKRSKYYKIRERTTLIYRNNPVYSYNIIEENEILPQRDFENSEGQESEITHS